MMVNMRLRISVGRSAQLVHGKHEFISRSVSLLFCNFFSCSSTEKSLIFLYLLNSPYLMMIRTFFKQTTAINGRKKTLCKYIWYFFGLHAMISIWSVYNDVLMLTQLFFFNSRKDINLFSMLKYITLQLLEIRNIDLYNTCIMQNINEDIFFLKTKPYWKKAQQYHLHVVVVKLIRCKNKFKTDNKKEQINKMYFITIRRSSRKKKKEEKAGIKLKACQSPHIFNKNCSHFQYGTVRITCSRIHQNLVSL